MLPLLRPLFRLGLTANEATVSGHRASLGYFQVSAATLASATFLKTAFPALPPSVTVGFMVIQCEGTTAVNVRWTDDGVTVPTAALGMQLIGGQELDYSGEPYLIQFILGAGSPKLNVSIYA